MAETINLRKIKQQAIQEARENFRRELVNAHETRAEAIKQALAAEKLSVDAAKEPVLGARKKLGEARNRTERELRRQEYKKASRELEVVAPAAAKLRKQAILAAERAEAQALVTAQRAAEAFVSRAVSQARAGQLRAKQAEAERVSVAKEEKRLAALDLQQKRQAEKEADKKRAADERLARTKKAVAIEQKTVAPTTAAPAPSMNSRLEPSSPASGLSQVQVTILVRKGVGEQLRRLEEGLRLRNDAKIVMMGGAGDIMQIVLMAPSAKSMVNWLEGLPFISELTAKGQEITLSLKAE
jgi:hypothetical protein